MNNIAYRFIVDTKTRPLDIHTCADDQFLGVGLAVLLGTRN